MGSKLIGGVLEKNSQRKAADRQYRNDIAARDEQRAYDRGALQRLVVDAEAAGFNPLTVLRNGGTSYQNSGAPLLSRREVGGSPVGDAFNAAGDFLRDFDPYADQKREQEYRLIESQISSLNAGALSRGPSSAKSVRRSYGTSDYEARPSGSAATLSKVNAPGEGTIVGGDDPTSSSLGLNTGRYGWFHAPWFPDAEAIETVYGDNELLSTVGGLLKVGADSVYGAYRNAYSVLEDTRSATLSLPNRQTKTQSKFLKEFNRNLDGMFGSDFKRKLKGAN